MDNEENGAGENLETESEIKEERAPENQLKEEKHKTEDETDQLSHRQAMAIWKEGLAEMIEVCTSL